MKKLTTQQKEYLDNLVREYNEIKDERIKFMTASTYVRMYKTFLQYDCEGEEDYDKAYIKFREIVEGRQYPSVISNGG